jgi:hypothetical protein
VAAVKGRTFWLAASLLLVGCPRTDPNLYADEWIHRGAQTDDPTCRGPLEIEPNGDLTMANPGPPATCLPHNLKGAVAGDVDTFRVDGDACGDSSPTATLSGGSNDVRLCLFVVCAHGRAHLTSCAGDPSSDGLPPLAERRTEGMRGCCRTGPGKVITGAGCDSQYASLPFGKHGWHAYLVVDRLRESSCVEYQVDYNF